MDNERQGSTASRNEDSAEWRHEVEIVTRDDRWSTENFDPIAAVTAAQTALADSTSEPLQSFEVAVVLTDDAESQALNKRWRGKDKPTNVLSFSDESSLPPQVLHRPLGDIVLAFETVSREANEAHRSLDDHAAHLVVHGILHLLGHDHEDLAEAETMEARETEILTSLGIPDPYTCDPEHTGSEVQTMK